MQAVVGRDCRLSGEKFQSAFVRGLVGMGVDVIDIGHVMTQMVYYGQYRFQSNGGAMITASHNPYNFNGFKLGIGFSRTTEVSEVQEIRRTVEREDFFDSERRGAVKSADIREDYFRDVLKRVVIKKKFKIVVDFRHGTPGNYIPELFEIGRAHV